MRTDNNQNEVKPHQSDILESFLSFVREQNPLMVNHGHKIDLFQLEQMVEQFKPNLNHCDSTHQELHLVVFDTEHQNYQMMATVWDNKDIEDIKVYGGGQQWVIQSEHGTPEQALCETKRRNQQTSCN